MNKSKSSIIRGVQANQTFCESIIFVYGPGNQLDWSLKIDDTRGLLVLSDKCHLCISGQLSKQFQI